MRTTPRTFKFTDIISHVNLAIQGDNMHIDKALYDEFISKFISSKKKTSKTQQEIPPQPSTSNIHTVPSSASMADDGTVRIAYEPPANQSSLRRSSRKRTLIIYDDPDDN